MLSTLIWFAYFLGAWWVGAGVALGAALILVMALLAATLFGRG